jgi:hypothetical protein
MPADTAQSPIDYAAGDTRTAGGTHTLFRVALACGIFPAVLGTVVTSLWLLTRWPGLVGWGLVTVGLGLLCVAVGGIALAIYVWRAVGSGRRPWLVRALLAGALLVANFPLCGVCISLAMLTDWR